MECDEPGTRRELYAPNSLQSDAPLAHSRRLQSPNGFLANPFCRGLPTAVLRTRTPLPVLPFAVPQYVANRIFGPPRSRPTRCERLLRLSRAFLLITLPCDRRA